MTSLIYMEGDSGKTFFGNVEMRVKAREIEIFEVHFG